MAIDPSNRKYSRIQAALGIDGWALWLFVIVAGAMIAVTVFRFAAQPFVWFSVQTGRCVVVEYGGSCDDLPETYRALWVNEYE